MLEVLVKTTFKSFSDCAPLGKGKNIWNEKTEVLGKETEATKKITK